MKSLYWSNQNIRSINKLLTLFLIILLPFLCFSADYDGPATGSGKSGKMIKVTNLPNGSKLQPKPDQSMGRYVIDPQLYEDLKKQKLTPFHGTASPEIDNSLSDMGIESEILNSSFEGITATGSFPPDPVIAVGQNHVILVVNSSVAIYDKDGIQLSQKSLSNWFNNVNPPGGLFDPKVVYDQHNSRWIILALSHSSDFLQSSYLVSVSATSAPTGSWYNYNLDATLNGSQSTNFWADFPGLGFDEEAVYLSSNQFYYNSQNQQHSFQYAKIRILDKSEIYNNQTVDWTDFWNMNNANGTKVTTIKPAHHFGSQVGGYLLNTHYAGSNFITLWRIDNPLNNPTLTRQASVSVGSYSFPPNAKQQSSSDDIDTGDARTQDVMYRDGYIYTSFTSGYNWGSGTVCAVRYVKIDVNSSTAIWDVVYGADNTYYYYPNIYVDGNGNMLIVFNRSSSTEYAGVYWAYRSTSDLNTRASLGLKEGEGPYSQIFNGRNRWGDYSGIALDAAIENQLWFYGEWATNNNSWSTWVGSYEFIPVTFTNEISAQGVPGSLKVNEGVVVNSGESIKLGKGSQNTVETLNERYINWQGSGVDYKHHDWNEDFSEYLLSHEFEALLGPQQNQDAKFEELDPTTTVKNFLISAQVENSGSIEFKDLWYVEPDGSQPGIFHEYDLPFTPGSGNYINYGGVFLDQDYGDPGIPYYSVRAPELQPMSFHGEEITWYFQSWDGASNEVSFKYTKQTETAVVFKTSDATAIANYKGHLASNTPKATAYNNGHCMVVDYAGDWHLVYEDNGYIYYSQLSDNEDNWSPEMWINDGSGKGYNPSLTVNSDGVHIVWYEINEDKTEVWYRTMGTYGFYVKLYEFTPTKEVHPVVETCSQEPYAYSPLMMVTEGSDGLHSIWSPSQKIPGTNPDSKFPSVQMRNNTYGIAYEENNEIYLIRYNPNGSYWYSPIAISMDVSNFNHHPSIAGEYTSSPYYWICWDAQGMSPSWKTMVYRSKTGTYYSFNSWLRFYYYPSIRSDESFPDPAITLSFEEWYYHDVYSTTFNPITGRWNAPVLVSNEGEKPNIALNYRETLPEPSDLVFTTEAEVPYLIKTYSQESDKDGEKNKTMDYAYSREISFDLANHPAVINNQVKPSGKFSIEVFPYQNSMDILDFITIRDSSSANHFLNSQIFTVNKDSIKLHFIIRGKNIRIPKSLSTVQSFEFFNFELIQAGTASQLQSLYKFTNDNLVSIGQDSFVVEKTITFNLKQFSGQNLFIGETILKRCEKFKPALIEKYEMVSDNGLSPHEILSDIDEEQTEPLIPNKFGLFQNYPNPFNPTTTLSFDLPKESTVILTIYDITGRHIKTLISSQYPAGSHQIQWDGTDDRGNSVASGVYVYRIEAGKYTQSRKLMLLK